MTKEDESTGNHYVHRWEPKIVKMVLEKLKAEQQEEEEEHGPATTQQQQDDDTTPPPKPFMLALVGIPGGGKSVSSLILANTLEEAGYPTMSKLCDARF